MDGYDGREQVAELSSVEFYRDAARALRGNGVLVVNLWGNDRRFDDLPAAHRGRLRRSGLLPSGGAARQRHRHGRSSASRWRRAGTSCASGRRRLEAAYGLEFPQFVGALKQLNPHTRQATAHLTSRLHGQLPN